MDFPRIINDIIVSYTKELVLVHKMSVHIEITIAAVDRTKLTTQLLLSCLSLGQWWGKDPIKDQSSYSVEY